MFIREKRALTATHTLNIHTHSWSRKQQPPSKTAVTIPGLQEHILEGVGGYERLAYNSAAPSIQKAPTLGSKIYKRCLVWAVRRPPGHHEGHEP